MKTIYYISNINNNLFPDNSRSNFRNHINIADLDHLPSGRIEVALKSITFDNTRISYQLEEVLGLVTNVIEPHVSSGGFDQILSIFTVKEEGATTIENNNPLFFIL